MLPTAHQLHLRIPADASTWAERIEAACAVVERWFPGEQLLTANVPRDHAPPLALADRRAFLKKALKTRTRWLSLTNDKPGDGYLTVGGKIGSAAPAQFELGCIVPAQPWERSEQLLAALGDALQAQTGDLTPIGTVLRLRAIQLAGARVPDPLAGTLPRLRFCLAQDQDAPEQPPMLAWLNYWSEPTCRFLGFPDPRRDERLQQLSWRTPGGAWLVKPTAQPLDLDRPGHHEAVAWMYERFPRLGPRPRPAAG